MKQVEQLYRNDGGIGPFLMNSKDQVVGNVSNVWRGEGGAPVGAIVKQGSSRYPKFYLIVGEVA